MIGKHNIVLAYMPGMVDNIRDLSSESLLSRRLWHEWTQESEHWLPSYRLGQISVVYYFDLYSIYKLCSKRCLRPSIPLLVRIDCLNILIRMYIRTQQTHASRAQRILQYVLNLQNLEVWWISPRQTRLIEYWWPSEFDSPASAAFWTIWIGEHRSEI